MYKSIKHFIPCFLCLKKLIFLLFFKQLINTVPFQSQSHLIQQLACGNTTKSYYGLARNDMIVSICLLQKQSNTEDLLFLIQGKKLFGYWAHLEFWDTCVHSQKWLVMIEWDIITQCYCLFCYDCLRLENYIMITISS